MSFRTLRFLLLLGSLAALLAGNALAHVASHTALKPESGTLALLGSGLVGLATLVRRHFNH